MLNEVATKSDAEIALKVSAEQLELIKRTIAPNLTNDELALYIFHCQRKKTHPMDQLIVPVVYGGNSEDRKISYITSIDFLRAESEDAGDYAGCDEPKYEEKEGQDYPVLARVTVYRNINGIKTAFVGVARWKEFYPGEKKGFMWRSKPYLMLGKCAESQARRLAWPKKFDKMYIPEEMEFDSNSNKSDKKSTVKGLSPEQKKHQQKPQPEPEGETEDPGPTEPDQKTEAQPAKSVKDKLIQAIYNYVDSNEDRVPEVLMEISKFEINKDGKPTGQYKFITPKTLDRASEAWLGNALKNLNARIEKENKEDLDNH